MVNEITYYMNESFAVNVYDSCKNVYIPSTGPAFGVMCGSWGVELCTPRRLFEFLGAVTSPYVPFQITYNFDETPEGIEPYDSKVYPCHVAVNVS